VIRIEESWWISSPKGTCQVDTVNEVITWTAPLWRKFVGQRIDDLERWLSKFGAVEKRSIRMGESSRA